MAKKKDTGALGRVVKYLILIAIALLVVLFIRTRLSADINAPGSNLPTYKKTAGGIIYFDSYENEDQRSEDNE